MKHCGYYCTFTNKNIKKSDYYRAKARNNNSLKYYRLWKKRIFLSEFVWL